jgi:hypothetical protein
VGFGWIIFPGNDEVQAVRITPISEILRMPLLIFI